MKPHLLAALACIVLFPAATVAADLTRSEIARELAGKEIAWWEQDGWRHGYLYLSPDGKAEMTVDRPKPQRDVGRWSLDGDRVCTQWNTLRDMQEKCYRVQRNGEGLFVTTGGNVFEIREFGV